jgi:hypothetical protein
MRLIVGIGRVTMSEAMKQNLRNMTKEELDAVDQSVFVLLHGWDKPVAELRGLILAELIARTGGRDGEGG